MHPQSKSLQVTCDTEKLILKFTWRGGKRSRTGKATRKQKNKLGEYNPTQRLIILYNNDDIQ